MTSPLPILLSVPFKIRGRESDVHVTAESIFWSVINKTQCRTFIPLERVISVRACFCRKPHNDRISCPCILEDLNYPQSSRVSSSSSSSPSSTSSSGYAGSTGTSSRATTPNTSPLSSPSGGSPSHPDIPAIKLVRIYYAAPRGKYGYKISFVSLTPITPSGGQSHGHPKKRHSTRGPKNKTGINELAESEREGMICDLINTIRAQLDGYHRPKKILVFVNPYGGKGLGPKIYREKVHPILQLAHIETECVITERADHARDTLIDPTFPLSQYSGVVCVGGDGMFAELLNGLIVRVNREAGIDVNGPSEDLIVPTMPLGVIPAGSTDAVAYGTTGVADPVTSTLQIVFGNRVNLDISAIHSVKDERLIRYATSFLGYGYFGDLIAESESHRWMGPKRYDYSGAKKFLDHRLYDGEVKMWLSPTDGSPTEKDQCLINCETCRRALSEKSNSTSKPGKGDNVSCITVRGRFMGVNAATMSCRCEKAKKGISPSAHLGNGCTDLILVSECSRAKYLQFLIRTGMSNESPFDLDFVDVYRVREFEFIPLTGGTQKATDNGQESETSVWNCDGEIIAEPAIHVRVHCQLIAVFGTGLERRSLHSTGDQAKSSKFSIRKLHKISQAHTHDLSKRFSFLNLSEETKKSQMETRLPLNGNLALV